MDEGQTHLDTPGEPKGFFRTGRLVPFTDVGIGQPFWAHGKVWVRTSYEAATEMTSTPQRNAGLRNWASTCNFAIDPWDKEVEALLYGLEDAA